MSFFNKKEEVLEIELTSYGKSLLAKGKLRPTHYAFLDDDIIYDAQYGASEEAEADKRIREETPRSRVQYNFSSVEDTKASRQETVPTTSGDIIKDILIQEQNRRNAAAYEDGYVRAWPALLLAQRYSSRPDAPAAVFFPIQTAMEVYPLAKPTSGGSLAIHPLQWVARR